jgi:hypothetical protein
MQRSFAIFRGCSYMLQPRVLLIFYLPKTFRLKSALGIKQRLDLLYTLKNTSRIKNLTYLLDLTQRQVRL